MIDWKDLNPQQRMALRNPCYLAEECAHPKYAHHDKQFSVVVTVNSGFE